MRALIVAAEPTGRALKTLLEGAEYSTYVAIDGEDGLDIAKRYDDFDVVVCELAVPGFKPCELTRSIRNAKVPVPIVIVSEEDGPQHIVEALHAGADDYVLSPYNPEELLARLCAVIRRAKGYSRSVIKIGGLVVNLEDRSVAVNGTPVWLTGKEWDVVEALALSKGRCLSKEQIFERLYKTADEAELKTIDVFICKIRKKLAKASGGPVFIDTVWGKGYRLVEPKPVPLRAVG